MALSAHVAALLAALISGARAEAADRGGADVGRWSVGDCVLAQFAVVFVVHPDVHDGNVTENLQVPRRALPDADQGNCGNASQHLILRWKDKAKNDTRVFLERNVTIVFAQKVNDSVYGVQRIYGFFEWGTWKEKDKDNRTVAHKSVVGVDTQVMARMQYVVPLGRSFLCADTGPLSLHAKLMYDYANSPPDGTKLNSTTVDFVKAQWDAFRSQVHPPSEFRTPLDCDYKPNDIVPITVGVALALVCIGILIAYLCGRRRSRQLGYESV